MTKKKCITCEKEYKQDDFYKTGTGIRSLRCKHCTNKKTKERLQKKKEENEYFNF